jgi:UDP-glucose 4-epimerase
MDYENYMVVGGAGFVGSHLVDLLIRSGAGKVVVLDNFFLGRMENLAEAEKSGRLVVYREDARYLTLLESVMIKEGVEAVFDCAIKPLNYSFLDPDGAFMLGVEIVHNLMYLLRKRVYRRLLHFSSSEVYGDARIIPMSEDHPLNPKTPYGAGKAAADMLVLGHCNLYGLEASVIRPFNMIGPRQNSGVYAAVVPITITRIMNGLNPILEGDGYQTRDFTYVGDVCEAALRMMMCDEALGKIVNVGRGASTRIIDLIRTICELMGHDPEEIDRRPPRPSDVRHHLASINLAEQLFGYKPKTSLREALKKTVDWYLSLP